MANKKVIALSPEQASKRIGLINDKVNTLMRNEIKDGDHIKTGKMLSETLSQLKVYGQNNYQMLVTSTNYFKYVNSRFGLIKNLKDTKEFKNIRKEIGEIFAGLTLWYIQQTLK
jgi:hypothetical protein